MSKLRKIISPIEHFLKYEASGGIILMFATAAAFYMANSQFQATYQHIVHLPVSFLFGDFSISKSFVHWVNDGLMALFFFVVGLEIKRELIQGELNTKNKAAWPVLAACGGAIIPALIYFAFNSSNPDSLRGWGIPMATDIAFAVGVLALFGKRVPTSLKIFLLALAIVDDLIAVLVIAFFYTAKINFLALGTAGVLFILTHALKASRVTNYVLYFLIGIAAWAAVFASGVHATIAGVVLGLMTPLRVPETEMAPLEELIHFLHPWVAFVIMPLFAFLNAGVPLNGADLLTTLQSPISLGVIVGLVLGKPIGIFLTTWMGQKLNLLTIPTGITKTQVVAIGFLAGIGFTMSLFIGGLSFQYPHLLDQAKIGILLASAISAIVGSFLLAGTLKKS